MALKAEADDPNPKAKTMTTVTLSAFDRVADFAGGDIG